MKKFLAACVALSLSILIINNAHAQQQQIKIGSFDEESVLGLMPGIQKVDTILQQYVADSLKVEYDYELSELKRKDSLLKDTTHKLNPSLASILQKEVSQHLYKIQNWQQYQNQMLQQKQEALLVPYRQKVYAALQEIITEQKYTYVFKSDVFFAPIPLKDNLSIKVAQKLKLPLPQEVQDALREQGLLEAGGATAPKPATKIGGAVKH